MSLVAYAASSGEEDSDYNDEEVPTSTNTDKKAEVAVVGTSKVANGKLVHGAISDDDEDDYAPTEFTAITLTASTSTSADNKKLIQGLSLPKPRNAADTTDPDEVMDREVTPAFSKLPLPKNKLEESYLIEEEDDEFLHKKATIPADEPKPVKPPLPSISVSKGPVKITIPSLKDFGDVEKDIANKAKSRALTVGSKGSSLLSILPQAKSEQNFTKASSVSQVNTDTKNINLEDRLPKPTANRFIPDTVKNRRPAHNTEFVDGVKKAVKKPTSSKPKPSLVDCSDSGESDAEDGGDFFSLKTDDKLPEVSMNEINALVAKRAAKMANAATEYLRSADQQKAAIEQIEMENISQQLLKQEQQKQIILDQQAMYALAGSSAKRRRKEANIEVVDISSAQVLPSRDEWMRTALASSTAYQPTGVLVDEEPASGTRRKHQITYLAHKAKANEAELQAMWAANRQNRRATQSKYGF